MIVAVRLKGFSRIATVEKGEIEAVDFVKRMFREFYSRDDSIGDSLYMIEQREFGFAYFEGWILRHKRFKLSDELREFLQRIVPSDVYFSSAYYEDPESEMDKKGWLGADLIFDVDADHIPSRCERVHDNWMCNSCGFIGKGPTPRECPNCSSQRFEVSSWPCEICLKSASEETSKLLDMLQEDLGFSKDNVRVYFSGHRGYHVHIENDAVKRLDAIERKEIVDYMLGLGIDLRFHSLGEALGKVGSESSSTKFSWRQRVIKRLQKLMQNASEESLSQIGLNRRTARILLSNKKAVLENLANTGTLGTIRGIGSETRKKLSEFAVRDGSAGIDTVVTTDIHRLIRMPGTLHSKTGLMKVEFPASSIDDFDPFISAVAFRSGSTTVLVSEAPRFRLENDEYGPYRKQEAEVPTAAALMLVCRNRAKVIE